MLYSDNSISRPSIDISLCGPLIRKEQAINLGFHKHGPTDECVQSSIGDHEVSAKTRRK